MSFVSRLCMSRLARNAAARTMVASTAETRMVSLSVSGQIGSANARFVLLLRITASLYTIKTSRCPERKTRFLRKMPCRS